MDRGSPKNSNATRFPASLEPDGASPNSAFCSLRCSSEHLHASPLAAFQARMFEHFEYNNRVDTVAQAESPTGVTHLEGKGRSSNAAGSSSGGSTVGLETMPNPAEIGRDCGKVVRVRMPIRSSMTHPVRSRSCEIVEMEPIFISAGWYCYADAVDVR